MAVSIKDSVEKICTIYTQKEASALLGVSIKSVQNYLETGKPSKKVIGKIQALYAKLKSNNWERIPLPELSGNYKELDLTPESVLLQVLVREFAEYKAKKEGIDRESIIKDIENKARIILEVVNRV